MFEDRVIITNIPPSLRRMKTIEVVAAIITNQNQIFCAQRNNNKLDYLAYKFEFPGGKVEIGETREAALLREIKEELEFEINIDGFLLTVDHQYPDFRLIMHAYACSAADRDYILNEHVAGVWLDKAELESLDWAAADVPIVAHLFEN